MEIYKSGTTSIILQGIGLKLDLPIKLGDVFELFGEKFDVLEPEGGHD